MRKEITGTENSNLFEGMVSLSALFSAKEKGINDRRIERVLFANERVESKARQLAFLRHRAAEYGFEVALVPLEQINALATGNSHGGVLAYCTERTTPNVETAIFPEAGFFVMLDGIEDPYNFGYAIRSLYAAGVTGVLLPPRNFLHAGGVVARASAGASELMQFFVVEDVPKTVERIKAVGYSVICTDTENAISIYDAPLTLPLLLVIGGEKRGIRREVLSLADAVVCLEYGREFSAALSAASAAGILSFEVLRRNR